MEIESRSERFRVPKTSCQENVLVNDAVPASTKYKNKWAVNIFAEWQRLREVKVPVLDCGGLYKDYDLHKVTAVSVDVATRIVLLFLASLHDNLFVFPFSLFCYCLSLLALRNTPVDYVTTPYTYSFIYCACLFLLGGLLASARFGPMFCLCIWVGFYRII